MHKTSLSGENCPGSLLQGQQRLRMLSHPPSCQAWCLEPMLPTPGPHCRESQKGQQKGSAEEAGCGGTSLYRAPSACLGGTANPGANREPVFQLPRKQGTLCVSGTDKPQSSETGASKSAMTTTGVTGSLQPEQASWGRPVHVPGVRHGGWGSQQGHQLLGYSGDLGSGT